MEESVFPESSDVNDVNIPEPEKPTKTDEDAELDGLRKEIQRLQDGFKNINDSVDAQRDYIEERKRRFPTASRIKELMENAEAGCMSPVYNQVMFPHTVGKKAPVGLTEKMLYPQRRKDVSLLMETFTWLLSIWSDDEEGK